MIIGYLSDFLKWITRERRHAQELALQAEATVRELSGLSPPPPYKAPDDIISVLKSTCLQLERLVSLDASSTSPQTSTSLMAETTAAEPPPEPTAVSSPPKQAEIPLPSKQALVSPPPNQAHEPDLSVTAKELIKLRDWILLAKSSETGVAPEVIEELYRKVGQILEKEDVIELSERGPYDYNRQQVVDTRPTDDPEQNDMVYATVRPGYLFHGKLIRPQEVIIYRG